MTPAGSGADWLVIIDPQRLFADPASDWGSPMWPDALPRILALAEAFRGRVILTRWVRPEPAVGSWADYMAAWPFADRPCDDPLYDLVEEAAALTGPIVTASTFGKWGPELQALMGPTPAFVLAGVSTDCCVVSTALPAADAGASVVVATDACAGSTPQNHDAALTVLGLYQPQIRLATTAEVLAASERPPVASATKVKPTAQPRATAPVNPTPSKPQDTASTR